MLFVVAYFLPEDLIFALLSEWLCTRDVCRLDSAVCASASRSYLLQCMSATVCTVKWTRLRNYSSDYLQWCIKRKVSVTGIHLRASNVTDISQASAFFQNCSRNFLSLMYATRTSRCPRCECCGMGLRTLALERCRIDIPEPPFELTVSCTLASLSLLGSNISDEHCATIFKNCPRLRNVNVGGCDRVTTRAFLTMAPHLPELETLFASDCRVLDLGFYVVAAGCRRLREVRFVRSEPPLYNVTEVGVLNFGEFY